MSLTSSDICQRCILPSGSRYCGTMECPLRFYHDHGYLPGEEPTKCCGTCRYMDEPPSFYLCIDCEHRTDEIHLDHDEFGDPLREPRTEDNWEKKPIPTTLVP